MKSEKCEVESNSSPLPTPHSPLFAVDIGNSRTKFALYEQGAMHRFRTISSGLCFCAEKKTVHWGIGSVCPAKTEKIVEQIHRKRPNDTITVLSQKDIPLLTSVDFPDKVGIDRLLAAYAAVCWKRKNRTNETHKSMLLCDLGTAITIDLVSPENVFLGGAILPGMNLAAKSLRRGTAQLPTAKLFVGGSFASSPFPGKNTVDAIRAGIFEGIIGTIRRFYDLATHKFPNGKPLLLLTGWDSELVYPEIQKALSAVFQPLLVLNGIFEAISTQNSNFT